MSEDTIQLTPAGWRMAELIRERDEARKEIEFWKALYSCQAEKIAQNEALLAEMQQALKWAIKKQSQYTTWGQNGNKGDTAKTRRKVLEAGK